MEAHQHSFLVCHSQTCNFTVGTILIASMYRERKKGIQLGLKCTKPLKAYIIFASISCSIKIIMYVTIDKCI